MVGTTKQGFIDVWNVESFDTDLLKGLCADAELICNYHLTEKKCFLEYSCAPRWIPYPANPYAGAYQELVARISREMEARTIRAWHYTRLTDAEADTLRGTGIYASTLETIRQRLDAQVAAGVF